jgi:hypothetical protein
MVYFGNYPASIGQFIPERPHVSSPPPSISQGRPVQSSAASIIEVDGVAMHITTRSKRGRPRRATTVWIVKRSANCSTIEPFDVGRDWTDKEHATVITQRVIDLSGVRLDVYVLFRFTMCHAPYRDVVVVCGYREQKDQTGSQVSEVTGLDGRITSIARKVDNLRPN